MLFTAAVAFGAFVGFSLLRNLAVQHAGPIAGSAVYLLLIPVVYLLVLQFHRRINALDKNQPGLGVRKTLATGVAGFAAGTGMFLLAVLLVGSFLVVSSEDIDLSLSVRMYPMIGFLLLAIVTAAWEELVFRGLISLLRLGQRRYHAALISSAFFVLPHAYLGNPQYPVVNLIGVFMFGMLLAQVYSHTGQIGWVVGLHAGWNSSIGGLEHLVAGAGGATAPMGETPEMFSELMQIFVIVCVYAFYLYRKREIPVSALEQAVTHG
jgi:membrane protease YdiL (CAAX protease family)